MTLIGGLVIMYETQALWGLEDNSNAATINSTFNTFSGLGPILIIVIVVIAAALFMTTSRGF